MPYPSTRWTLPACDRAAAAKLAAAAQVPEIVAQLLLGRGITTAEEAKTFFEPTLDHLHDPYRMLGMREAVERIQRAVVANEPILIYGDYDVDGTTATVLLKTAIERLGLRSGTKPDVRYHVPHRLREGYGMQSNVLAAAYEDGVRLVISVDTGVRAFAAAKEAKRLQLDLIVTDHHLPDEERGVPEALAVLNPNQDGCMYPAKDLCGAGVAFKLAQALLEAAAADDAERERLRAKILPSFLKLLAIATIADSVPLHDENRVITSIGLRELRNPVQPGLRELMRLAELDPAKGSFSTTDIGFRLAPRINAAGRMDVASDVVDLFLTRDLARATELAEKLNGLNEARRATELEALTAIETMLAADALLPKPVLSNTPVIVLDGAEWHRGVIGILASRVVDRMHRPALVITHNPHSEGEEDAHEGVAHGSGRSIAGFHLLDALTAVDIAEGPPLFTRFGGHAHAVGFSLPSGLVPELRERMTAYAAEKITPESMAKEVVCHAELPLERITPVLAKWVEKFEPLGMGNPTPVFITHGVLIAEPVRKIKDKHIKLRLKQGKATYSCLAWNWAERAEEMGLAEGSVIDIAYKLRENTHPEFGGLELELCDVVLPKTES